MMLLRLIKFKLTLAVTLTAATGFLIFDHSAWSDLLILSAGTFLVAGGASAFNQYQEREYDSLMGRTKSRPLPSGSVKPRAALEITLIMIIAGLLLLLYLSWISMLLGLINVVVYNTIYTNLKRVSYLAIIPGAFVGAVPPLMGYTAAGGAVFDKSILFISFIIFLWQVPHFWMLLIRFRDDYERAGFPTVLRKLNEKQVLRIVFSWITMVSFMAVASILYMPAMNRYIWYIIVSSNFLFTVVFFLLLFSKKKDEGRAFILSNIYISILYLLLAAGAIL